MPDTNQPRVSITLSHNSTVKLDVAGAPRDYVLNVLTGLLWSPAPICTAAIDTLTELGTQSVPHLIKAYAADNLAPSMQEEVSKALRKWGSVDWAAVAELARQAKEVHSRPRAVLIALAKIAPDDKVVLRLLEELALNEHDGRQADAIEALNTIGSYSAMNILMKVPVHQPSEQEEVLIKNLKSKSGEQRLAALAVVQSQLPTGADLFADLVLDLFDHEPDPQVRLEAARYITGAVPCSTKSLNLWLADLINPDSGVHRAIIYCGTFAPILEWLTGLLCSAYTPSSICYLSARALRSFGEVAVPYLVTALSSFAGHPQHVIARELGKMGRTATAAVPELLRITNHSRSLPWGGTRSAILDALAQIAPDDHRVMACLSKLAINKNDTWHHAAVAALNSINLRREQSDSSSSAAIENAESFKRFIGKYHGVLLDANDTRQVDTTIKLSADKKTLVGHFVIYSTHNSNGNSDNNLEHEPKHKPEYGELTLQASLKDKDHLLVMEWSDATGNGILEATFNPNFTEFLGQYYPESEAADAATGEAKQRSWSGLRTN